MTNNANTCSEYSESMELKPTIMVVDDEPQIGQMLTKFLGKHNYRVIFFTSGKKAIAYLSASGETSPSGVRACVRATRKG